MCATLAPALAILALAGCGTAMTSKTPATAPTQTTAGTGSGSFAWLASGRAVGSAPAGVLAAGALARPSGWRPVRGDPGSVSFAQLRAGAIVGYLNATPRSGAETLANWSRFRIAHNAEEGDREVRLLASVTRMGVGSARVSCVVDAYRTSLSRYREIACLVARPGGAAAVVLGAAPPGAFSHLQPDIERAIAGFTAGR